MYNGNKFKNATGFNIIEDSIKSEHKLKEFMNKVKKFGYVKT